MIFFNSSSITLSKFLVCFIVLGIFLLVFKFAPSKLSKKLTLRFFSLLIPPDPPEEYFSIPPEPPEEYSLPPEEYSLFIRSSI